jgi:hypothetical protein
MAYWYEPSQIPRSSKELSVSGNHAESTSTEAFAKEICTSMEPLYDESILFYEISIPLGICDELSSCRLHRVVQAIGENVHPGKGE